MLENWIPEKVPLSKLLKNENLNEEWRDIPGFNGNYQVSDLGRVRSLLAFRPQTGWYSKITIKKPSNGKRYAQLPIEGKTFLVHRLVLLVFVGESKLHCNHKDGNPRNNRLDNLEYCTPSENLRHSYDFLGRISPMKGRTGKLNHKSRPVLKIKDGEIVSRYDSASLASKEHGNGIANALSKRNGWANDFFWLYEDDYLANNLLKLLSLFKPSNGRNMPIEKSLTAITFDPRHWSNRQLGRALNVSDASIGNQRKKFGNITASKC
jgi:hypothetical protein